MYNLSNLIYKYNIVIFYDYEALKYENISNLAICFYRFNVTTVNKNFNDHSFCV